MKLALNLTILLALMVLIIPSIVVLSYNTKEDIHTKENISQINKKSIEKERKNKSESAKVVNKDNISVEVYRSGAGLIQSVELDEYVKGVLSSEMPLSFDEEALKAQAVVARTYIIKRLLNGNDKSSPEGSDVTDTIFHQVYKDNNELKNEWGKYSDKNNALLNRIIQETEGLYIAYNNKPIEASFFSTSNGYTENSEDYWSLELPYLRSVPSPWDKKSDKFYAEKSFPVQKVEKALKIKIGNQITVDYDKTIGKRNKFVKINGKSFEGKSIREIFDLNSTDFEILQKDSKIIFKTRGYGHGVGLSQYGANYQAIEGKSFEEIIKYYYKGVTIESIDKLNEYPKLVNR